MIRMMNRYCHASALVPGALASRTLRRARQQTPRRTERVVMHKVEAEKIAPPHTPGAGLGATGTLYRDPQRRRTHAPCGACAEV